MDVPRVANGVLNGREIEVVQDWESAGGVCSMRADIPAGARLFQHSHTYSHISILARGRVRVTLVDAGKETVYEAPERIFIEAGERHGIEALTDATWFCIHADKD